MAIVKPIPEGYATCTPYIYVRGGDAAIEFYKKAFGATERFRMPMPGGRLGHAEIQLGNSIVMMADEMPEMGVKAPPTLGGSPVSFLLYVEDVDKAFARAVGAGAKSVQPVENKFYGDRMGTVEDPFGHKWSLATHVEDVSPEEMNKRMEKEMAKMKG
ncbi:MAG: Glyoxalase/bleomycin resistance protein/dioxygenase [Labilithrix sp.]|nr:Glyoxalase/bleomycin resistance protein/dioxygenase [Labilithrix sp.]